MSIDLDELRRQAEEARRPRPTGTAATLSELHRHPAVRDQVTLETMALAPVPHQAAGGLELITLLAVSARRSAEELRLRPAWGLVRWSWPGLSPSSVERLEPGLQRTDGWDLPPAVEVTGALRVLCSRLDEVLERPWPPNVDTQQELAQLYRRVLPPAALEILGEVAADTRGWLGTAG